MAPSMSWRMLRLTMMTRVARRLAAMLGALLVLAITPVAVSASATTTSQILKIDLAGFAVAGPCWSDQLTIDRGNLILVLHYTTAASGSVHATANFTYTGVQAISGTGAQYVVQSETHSTYVVVYDSGLYESNLVLSTRWVSQGAAPNYFSSAWIHTTRTPSGDIAVDTVRFDAVCP